MMIVQAADTPFVISGMNAVPVYRGMSVVLLEIVPTDIIVMDFIMNAVSLVDLGNGVVVPQNVPVNIPIVLVGHAGRV